MATMIRIVCSGISKEDWHPETLQGVLLCLVFVPLGCRLFRGCDAAIEISGSLSPSGQPKAVSIKCWFSVGALKGYSIRQTRRRFADPGNKTQALSITPGTSSFQDPKPLKLLGGLTTLSGSLKDGVTFTLQRATCQDAGLYSCEFHFQTVHNNYLVTKNTQEHKLLHMYAVMPRCVASPGRVDFSRLSHTILYLRVSCQVKGTAKMQWVWETKGPGNGSRWMDLPKKLITSSTPLLFVRCRKLWSSVLLVQIQPTDKNRMYRISIRYGTRLSKAVFFTLRDSPVGGPVNPRKQDRLDFQKALTVTGWVMLGLVLSIVITLLLVHTLYPTLERWQLAGRRLTVMRLQQLRAMLPRVPFLRQQTTGQTAQQTQQQQQEQQQQQQTQPADTDWTGQGAGGQGSGTGVDSSVDNFRAAAGASRRGSQTNSQQVSLDGFDMAGAEDDMDSKSRMSFKSTANLEDVNMDQLPPSPSPAQNSVGVQSVPGTGAGEGSSSPSPAQAEDTLPGVVTIPGSCGSSTPGSRTPSEYQDRDIEGDEHRSPSPSVTSTTHVPTTDSHDSQSG